MLECAAACLNMVLVRVEGDRASGELALYYSDEGGLLLY